MHEKPRSQMTPYSNSKRRPRTARSRFPPEWFHIRNSRPQTGTVAGEACPYHLRLCVLPYYFRVCIDCRRWSRLGVSVFRERVLVPWNAAGSCRIVSHGVETHYEYSTGGSWHGCVRNPLFIAAEASVPAFSAGSGLGGGEEGWGRLGERERGWRERERGRRARNGWWQGEEKEVEEEWRLDERREDWSWKIGKRKL